MSDHTSWTVGAVTLERVPYFDIGLAAESIDLVGLTELDWASPWVDDAGQPLVGQAFWVIRSGATTMVVDPCGASDAFLRSGREAVDHQNAALALLDAAGCPPGSVDHVVLTHLDGIGMAALADGGPAGNERWSPAFPNADVLISTAEHEFIRAAPDGPMGVAAYNELDRLGLLQPVGVPHELAPGVRLRPTAAHSPGHCCIDITSDGHRAVLLGHLAISPLHAAAEVSANHIDPEAAWRVFAAEMDQAAATGALLTGSLWPSPGAARVTTTAPYVLTPALA